MNKSSSFTGKICNKDGVKNIPCIVGGVAMEDVNPVELQELEVHIKLHINDVLFEQGLITEELHQRAKTALLAS